MVYNLVMNAFDSEIFLKNFAALKERSPDTASKLMSFRDNPQHDLSADEGRELTLLVDGLQLTSHHDRMRQAEFNLRDVDRTHPVHLYGYGLGDELRTLLEGAPRPPAVTLHIICPVLTLQIMCVDDGFAELMQGDVEVVLDPDEVTPQANRAVNLTELRLESGFCNALKLRIISDLERDYASRLFERSVGARINRAILANADALRCESFLKKDELPSKDHCVLAASGPSLERNFSALERERADGAYVIAVDTALIYLEKRGFVPDAVVSVDDLASKKAGTLFMKDPEIYSGTLLVFAPSSDPKLWMNYPGMRRCLVTPRALKLLSWLQGRENQTLYSSGSVTLTAVSLALAMGTRKISLIGADFAYEGESAHAGICGKDTLIAGRADAEIECNDGQMRKTQRNFAVYREDLENLIAASSQIEFENLSECGARIAGAPYRGE